MSCGIYLYCNVAAVGRGTKPMNQSADRGFNTKNCEKNNEKPFEYVHRYIAEAHTYCTHTYIIMNIYIYGDERNPWKLANE